MLVDQLDFIFFFYGLAFLLLGTTCWTTARGVGRRGAWAALGLFGFTHGISEWLALAALIVGDTPAFAATRTALLAVSFVLLLEFARLEGRRLGMRVPGRWVHAVLLALVLVVGIVHGTVAADISARYAIGFVGAACTALVLARQALALPNCAIRFAIAASTGFLLYALCAGVVVPAAPFWPASVVNQQAFAAVVGVPVQLVRGVLACWISFCVWGIWSEQLAAEVSSSRFTRFVRGQFIRAALAMSVIVAVGWVLTESLGGIYRENVQEQASSDLDLLSSRLEVESAAIDGMARALAGSPSVVPALAGGATGPGSAQAVLELAIDASGASSGFITDASGNVVSSSRQRQARPGRPAAIAADHVRAGLAGTAQRGFAFDPASGRPVYYSSQPVRDASGRVVGVAVLARALDRFQADLRQFDRPYFLIDPHGVVVLTNRPDTLFRPLWPVYPATRPELVRQYPRFDDRPLLSDEVTSAGWTRIGQQLDHVRRAFASAGGWSLVILEPTREIFASRLLGIVITLLLTLMALVYLIGRGRWAHDDAQAWQRLQLQELAQDLGVKATTDPLTGLHNRLMLEQTLAAEIARAERYGMPLSVVLYDIDHFKQVNDTLGHRVGDRVLVQMARLVPTLIRNTDLLVRWGGEEFLILMPGSDAGSARQAAEKLRDAIARVDFAEAGRITCSFGAAQYVPGESTEAFVARADAALYRAKHAGRNQVQAAPAPDDAGHGGRDIPPG